MRVLERLLLFGQGQPFWASAQPLRVSAFAHARTAFHSASSLCEGCVCARTHRRSPAKHTATLLRHHFSSIPQTPPTPPAIASQQQVAQDHFSCPQQPPHAAAAWAPLHTRDLLQLVGHGSMEDLHAFGTALAQQQARISAVLVMGFFTVAFFIRENSLQAQHVRVHSHFVKNTFPALLESPPSSGFSSAPLLSCCS